MTHKEILLKVMEDGIEAGLNNKPADAVVQYLVLETYRSNNVNTWTEEAEEQYNTCRAILHQDIQMRKEEKDRVEKRESKSKLVKIVASISIVAIVIAIVGIIVGD